MTTRPIRLFFRGRIVEIAGARPTRTVLEWLREDQRCTGTKEGCNEGDCGACTVVVGSLEASASGAPADGLSLQAVNACIQLLASLDGKALFTVEDLQPMAGGALHPVQQAMVDCHGSQCGFCTPGFVMSLWSTYEHGLSAGTQPTRQQLADALAGNLCRCTGYRPILDAGARMFELPPVHLDAASVVAALAGLRGDAALALETDDMRFEAPRSVEAFAAARLERPTATLVAGTTDVGLWITKQLRELPELLSIGAVDELKRIERDGDDLVIGAGASLEAAYRALVAQWPGLEDVWLRFASVPIRNAGTMGGNIANGSPIGDSAPVLMALDATVELRRGARVRRLPLAEFYVDYLKNRLESGEFIQALRVPVTDRATVRAYKVSKRFDSDISAVCAGLAIELDGERVAAARFAFGGMAAVVRRASGAEAAVVGQPWNEETVAAAERALGTDFTPLTDMRASAAYRARVAQNLLRRFWLETRRDDPLDAAQLSVWSTMAHATAASTPASERSPR